jgi:hypothetical protein
MWVPASGDSGADVHRCECGVAIWWEAEGPTGPRNLALVMQKARPYALTVSTLAGIAVLLPG